MFESILLHANNHVMINGWSILTHCEKPFVHKLFGQNFQKKKRRKKKKKKKNNTALNEISECERLLELFYEHPNLPPLNNFLFASLEAGPRRAVGRASDS